MAGAARRRLRRLQAQRRSDLPPFELVPCDVFVTEATFALPVFRHEPADGEVARLLASIKRNPERAHLVGVYGLGKCQRVIKLCREAGYDAPIYLHGALVELTNLYQRLGVDLGDIRHVGADDSSVASPARSSSARRLPSTTAGRAASPIP